MNPSGERGSPLSKSFVQQSLVHGKIPAMSFIIVVGIIARFLLKFNEREFPAELSNLVQQVKAAILQMNKAIEHIKNCSYLSKWSSNIMGKTSK